jgi:hypothetical protein
MVHDIDRGAVEVRRGNAREWRSRRRSRQNSDALRVGRALGNQVLDAPGDIVLHLASPLAVAGVQDFLP